MNPREALESKHYLFLLLPVILYGLTVLLLGPGNGE